MGTSITDLFRSETEFEVKASEMYAVIRESVKAELLMNAVKCEIPHTYARQIITGKKEDAPLLVGIDLSSAKDWTSDPDPDPLALSGSTNSASNGSIFRTLSGKDARAYRFRPERKSISH